MLTPLAFNTLVWVCIGQIVAFSIGLLLFKASGKAVIFWLAANIAMVIGLTGMMADTSQSSRKIPEFAAVLQMLALNLRGWSLSQGSLITGQNRFATAFSAIGFVCIGLFLLFGETAYRSLIINLSGLATAIAAYIYLTANRAWRGLSGQRQLQVLYAILAALLTASATRAYPFGPHTRFFGDSYYHMVGTAILMVVAFFMQIFFINLLVGRQARLRQLAVRRNARIKERSRILLENNETIERLASERLNLLRMMTHEVRQPLNNAQAALQAVMNEVSSPDQKPQLAKDAATRVQVVLDEVILSLSNSIVAASIIEWKNKPSFIALGANETLALATIDCPSTERGRIAIRQPEDEIYVHADPVLLRLALRNLLSNALKYSPPGSKVTVDVVPDEERFGVAFRATNRVTDPRLLMGNLLARGKRGMDNTYEGFGLGLFMVNETARIHEGELAYWQSSPEEVTFELFLPL